MTEGHFYFIDDKYFVDFPDPKLMRNKESLDGEMHDRPCFYAFQDKRTGLFWMIPFSSKVDKFETIYNTKILKYKRCDTIVFGNVLGSKKAFLIQNMCPLTEFYIRNEYIDSKSHIPVQLDAMLSKELLVKAKRVLELQRRGIPLIFPDVLAIERILLSK